MIWHKTKSRRSFVTLVELLAVMFILSVLLGLSIGVFQYASSKSAESKTRALIKKVEVALENYKSKYGYYIPAISSGDWTDVNVGRNQIHATSRVCAFYLDYPAFNLMIDGESLKAADTQKDAGAPNRSWLVDTFGSPIYYRCPGLFNRTSFDIGSLGSDAKLGDAVAVSDANFGTASAAKGSWGKGDDITNFTNK
ncbi:MAG: hypothetical protein A2017_03205 [Lentisphaerae bacterium GWF2_44_16]|nr:MAG: hypothetical protein A2017_03205 [Lentisphaerae bacterium GWF2_44_16]